MALQWEIMSNGTWEAMEKIALEVRWQFLQKNVTFVAERKSWKNVSILTQPVYSLVKQLADFL